MTSEVENILNGQVVRKVNADKAIGVSTANLMPDEKGEVPLSKQSAFEVSNVAETKVEPQIESAMPVSEQVDLTQSTQAVSTSSEPETPIIPTPAITPTESVVSDTISETPVNVTEPTELSGIDFKSVIPDIPFATEEPQVSEVEEPEIKNVELPEMPETILAEEPTSVNEGLFVDSTVPTTPEETIQPKEEVETSAINTADGNNIESNIPTVDDSSTIIEPSRPNPVESGNVEEKSLPETNENGITPQEPEIKSIFSSDGTVEDTTPNNGLEEKTKEKESLNNIDQKFLDELKKVESDENEKLEKINKTLNEIVDSLKELKELFEVKQKAMSETKTLEFDNNEPLSTNMLQEPTTQMPQEPLAPLAQEPMAQSVPEPTPMIPTMDIPLFEGPSLDLATGMVQAPNIEQPNDMVNALDQMEATEMPSVDETPIKGGMFI